MADFDIARALQGFGAGVGGQLPQFLQLQQQEQMMQQEQAAAQQKAGQEQRKQMVIDAEARRKTMFEDADAYLKLAKEGKWDSLLPNLIYRKQMLGMLQQDDPTINTEDTDTWFELAKAARNGNRQAAELLKADLEETVQGGAAFGFGKQPEIIPQSSISPTGQVAFRNPDGSMAAQALPGFQAPAQEGFQILSPAEAAQLGLPSDKQFQRNTQNQQISQIGSGPAVQVNTGTATEGERTAGILANRLDFAQSQINDVLGAAPESAAPGVAPSIFNAMGLDYLARVTNPAERQIIEAAQDDMLDAALTLGTGAAYTKEQLQGYKRSFFPQLGDDQKTIEAKAVRLSNLLNAAYEKAGRGAPEQRRSAAGAVAPTPALDDPLGILQ